MSARTRFSAIVPGDVGRLFFIGLAAAALSFALACEPRASSGPNSLSRQEKDEGWILLFNGRSLKGWHGLGFEDIPEGRWAARGGAIVTLSPALGPGRKTDRQGFDLATDAVFTDFELSFEWRVGPGGNSGLKYNVSDKITVRFGPQLSGRGGAVGFEYQLLDDAANPDARVGPRRRAGSLYDIVPVAAGRTRPVGEFNTARIILRGSHGEHWLNGVKALAYDLDSSDFRTRLAASKFGRIPGFAARHRGPIVLQFHGDAVAFRAIKIRRLDPARRPPAERPSAPAP
jgi:hypothetical protein